MKKPVCKEWDDPYGDCPFNTAEFNNKPLPEDIKECCVIKFNKDHGNGDYLNAYWCPYYQQMKANARIRAITFGEYPSLKAQIQNCIAKIFS